MPYTTVRDSTPTGIPIRYCGTCGHRHPISRRHCATCGLATLFGHHGHITTYAGAEYTTPPLDLDAKGDE